MEKEKRSEYMHSDGSENLTPEDLLDQRLRKIYAQGDYFASNAASAAEVGEKAEGKTTEPDGADLAELNSSEFWKWMNEGEQKMKEREIQKHRKKKLRRTLAAAAVFACIVIGASGLIALDIFQPEEGVAGPGTNDSVVEENGTIVIGGDGNGNIGTWRGTFKRYEELPEQYKQEFIWFGDFVEGFNVDEIEIVNEDGELFAFFTLRNDKNQVINVKESPRKENNNQAIVLNQYERKQQINEFIVYSKKTEKSKIYTFVAGEKVVFITMNDDLENEKIETIIASIKTD